MSSPREGWPQDCIRHFHMGFPGTPRSAQGIQKGQNELLPGDWLFKLVLVCLFALKEGYVYVPFAFHAGQSMRETVLLN